MGPAGVGVVLVGAVERIPTSKKPGTLTKTPQPPTPRRPYYYNPLSHLSVSNTSPSPPRTPSSLAPSSILLPRSPFPAAIIATPAAHAVHATADCRATASRCTRVAHLRFLIYFFAVFVRGWGRGGDGAGPSRVNESEAAQLLQAVRKRCTCVVCVCVCARATVPRDCVSVNESEAQLLQAARKRRTCVVCVCACVRVCVCDSPARLCECVRFVRFSSCVTYTPLEYRTLLRFFVVLKMKKRPSEK